ncbi:hypothetical protein AXG93_3390s1010 [Marchantia polymorpha subsp. ruderalis]|uniref:Uncharacterized protein n=1 Tax=Marchantia polymorpha subsp. ruderalis TaxID=1480154 RepID=A0A176VTW0_MARPO|nr:hypothetical protein AXG93_3390s1010 [Marchantia polymorpha subsp. ruderalis]
MVEMEITDDEETLGGNKVASEEDDIMLALPSAKVDKLKDKVEEWPKKKRRLYPTAILKTTDHRAGIRDQSKAASQGRITSAEWIEIEAVVAGTEEEGPLW